MSETTVFLPVHFPLFLTLVAEIPGVENDYYFIMQLIYVDFSRSSHFRRGEDEWAEHWALINRINETIFDLFTYWIPELVSNHAPYIPRSSSNNVVVRSHSSRYLSLTYPVVRHGVTERVSLKNYT